MSKSSLTSIPEYYHGFIALISEEEVVTALQRGLLIYKQYIELIPNEKGDYRYADGKWSVKELLQHLVDTELIFNYRALSFARGEATHLPGYNHDEYVQQLDLSDKSLTDIGALFIALRNSTIALFQSFSKAELDRKGTANGLEVSVELIGFIAEGHMRHHLNIIQERYL